MVTSYIRAATVPLLTVMVSFSVGPLSATRQVAHGQAIPTYSFDQGPLSDWLLLGPIVRGTEPSDPVAELENPSEGKQVRLSEKDVRSWVPSKTDANGALVLSNHVKDFFRSAPDKPEVYQNADNKICYAYCKVKGKLGTKRQILVAMDDGGRAWLDETLVIDDVQPDWAKFYEHRIELDFTQETEQDLLFELHNWTGDFSLYCYGGYSIAGTATYLDSVSPVANSLVQVEINGQPIRAIPTDASGKFAIPAVPFGSATTVKCEANSYDIAPYDQSPLPHETGQDKLSLPVTRSTQFEVAVSRAPIPPAVYEAMTETADGELIVAKMADKSIHRFNGLSFAIHPDEQLQNFTSATVARIAEAPSGELWIATDGDGLFRYSNGRLDHWGSPETGEENYALKVLENGDILASFRLKRKQPEHAVYRIRKGESSLEKLPLPKCNPIWSIATRVHPENGSELLLVPRLGRIIAMSNSGFRFISVPNFAELSSVAQTEDDTLWFAGRGLFKLDINDQWVHYHVVETDIGTRRRMVYRDAEGTVWYISSSAVYALHNGILHRTVVPANSRVSVQSCLTSNGAILIAENSGIVHAIERSRTMDYGPRHGLTTGRISYLSRMKDQIYLSNPETIPTQFTEGGFVPVTQNHAGPFLQQNGLHYPKNQMAIHALSGNRLVSAPAWHATSGTVMNTTLPPLLRDEAGTWHEIDTSIWETSSNVYIFCKELSDGRILLSTREGLAELRDQKLVASNLLDGDEALGVALAAQEDTKGRLWIVTCSGNVVIVDGDQRNSVEFPVQTNCTGTIMCQHQGDIWIGNSAGLFRCRSDRDVIEKVSGQRGEGLSVVGLETLHGKLWVIDRHGTVLVANDDLEFASVDIFGPDRVRVVHSTMTDERARIWFATDSGVRVLQPSLTAPRLFIDSINSKPLPPTAELAEQRAECDFPISFRLAAQDDTDGTIGIRHRVAGGPWLYGHSDIGNLLRLTFDRPGSRDVEFQAYDGEWNTSNIVSVKVNAFRPVWRTPSFRWATGIILAAIATLAAYLFMQLVFARRSQARIRESLLVEESRARALAEETSRERAMLLARVCHDLRNPLSVVGVVRELLLTEQVDSEPNKLANLLKQSQSNMKYLTDQLLTYSRSRAEQSNTRPEEINIREFIAEFSNEAELRLRETNIAYQVHVSKSFPDTFVTDPNILREILGNIFDNAVRYTEAGTISFECASTIDGKVNFTLEDTGKGMSEEMVQSVFEPFFRGKNEILSDGNVGLGMNIVYELTKQLGGQVSISSELGRGTSVSLSIPSKVILKGPPEKRDEKTIQSKTAEHQPHAPHTFSSRRSAKNSTTNQ